MNDDDYSLNIVNFQARISRFCMEVDLDNTYNIMMTMIMIFMIMMIKAVTQSIFKLGSPDFAWQ